jgi:hypothetical protein
MVASSNEISERAIALAGEDDRAGAVTALASYAGDQHSSLELARDILVKRIRIRSDDYPATSGLTLINRALSQVGSPGTSTWKPRKWRLPR